MSVTVEIVVAMSLDGRISTADRRPWRWSDPEDHAWLLSRMAEADVVVVGGGTVRAENPSVTVPAGHAQRRVAEGRTAQPVRVVLSPSLSIPPDCRAAGRTDARLLIAATREAITAKGAAFEGRATLVPLGPDGALRPVLETACEFADGGRTVCLGGGRTNALFLEQDLVDTLSLTVSSFVIGAAAAPGPFDGSGWPPGRFPRFRLEEMRRAGRDVVLRYARDRDAATVNPGPGLE